MNNFNDWFAEKKKELDKQGMSPDHMKKLAEEVKEKKENPKK